MICVTGSIVSFHCREVSKPWPGSGNRIDGVVGAEAPLLEKEIHARVPTGRD